MKPVIICCIILPLVAWGLLLDAANTNRGGSIDLRNRVTGARVATFDKDPYIYKWNSKQPTVFCDLYNEPGALLSKTTVTPWALANQAIFNSFNYRTIQWLWLFIQYVVIISAVLLWGQCCANSEVSMWGFSLALLFFLTPCWRHHVDHGQIYAVYAGLLLIVFWLSQRASRSIPLALTEGAISAFTLGCRPIFISQLAEPASKKRWYTLIGAVLGLLLVLLIPMMLFGQTIWVQYQEAMEAHAENYLNQRKPERVTPPKYPVSIENIPIDVISGYNRNIPFADTSIYKLISFALPAKALLICWLLAMAGNLFYLVKQKASSQLIWWLAIAWIIIGDFLLPAFRHTYNDVFAIPLFLIGLSAIQSITPKFQTYWWGACTATLLLMILSWKLDAAWFLTLPSVALLLLACTSVGWSTWIAKTTHA